MTRIFALVALFSALLDAAQLLGIGPHIVELSAANGQMSFAYLAVFTLGRLFSGVGMWIEASWGTVLLFIVAVAELFVLAFGLADFALYIPGWILRAVLLFASGGLLGYAYWLRLKSVHD